MLSREGVRPVGVYKAFIDTSYESDCLWMQSKFGGKLHLRLNTCVSPIANKYREGKLKRTLKRELNSTWNRLEVNEWSRSSYMGFSWLCIILILVRSVSGIADFESLIFDQCTFHIWKLRPIVLFFCRDVEGDQFFGIGFIAHCMVKCGVLVNCDLQILIDSRCWFFGDGLYRDRY